MTQSAKERGTGAPRQRRWLAALPSLRVTRCDEAARERGEVLFGASPARAVDGLDDKIVQRTLLFTPRATYSRK
jgi:hypothetical protein